LVAGRPGEWKNLFDGKSLDGWETVGKPWKVSSHALTASERTLLRTAATYADFELEFEWRMDRGANGGVFYLVGEGDNHRGPELQLCDPKAAGTTQSGGLYGVLDPSRDESKGVGNWNTARLLVRGNHREHWINGTKVVSYDIDDPAYLGTFESSKMKGPAGFKSPRAGYIILQCNTAGAEVAYRNLRIRDPGR
jgi:hypothetical protein